MTPEPPDRSLDVDTTGVLAIPPPRLADFLDDATPLPFGYLLAVAGPLRGQGLLVESLPAVIGRAADAVLRVTDDTVSRHHVELAGERELVTVRDLGSANGTLLNGNPIADELHLRDGDLLELGSTILLVKLFT